jgi:hypothetical protein
MTTSNEVTINVSEDLATSLRAYAKANDIAQSVLFLSICTFKESNPSLGDQFYGSGTGGADAHTQISQAAKDCLRFPEAVAGYDGMVGILAASAYRKSIADNPLGGQWQATMSTATIARTWKTGTTHPELIAKRTDEDGKKKNGIVHITTPRTKKDDKGKDVNVKGSVKVDLESLKQWIAEGGVIDFNAERNDAPPTDASKGKDPTERHADNLARVADLLKQVTDSKGGKWKPGCKNSEGKKIEFAMTADQVNQLKAEVEKLAAECASHNAMQAAPVAATG